MKTRKITFLPLIALLLSLGGCEKGTKVTFFSNGSNNKNVTEETNTIGGSNEQDGNTDNTSGNEHINPTGVFNLEVKGESNLASGNLKSGVYPPGYEFIFTIQSVSDATYYPYLNSLRLVPVDYDENYNRIYSFTMPVQDCVLAIGDSFYVNRNYTLKEILSGSFGIDEDSIKTVIIEKGSFGTNLNDEIVIESSDKRDISYNYNFYLKEPFCKTETNGRRDEGTYTHLIFVTQAGIRLNIEINNGVVQDQDFMGLNLFTYANRNHNEPKIEYPSNLDA